MSTRPLGSPLFVPEDPGPWSGILDVLQRRGNLPGRRRAEPPNGLMISPPPRTALLLAGGDEDATAAGAGPVRVAAAAREAALSLTLDGDVMRGVSKMVRRAWNVDTLALVDEVRPDSDPAADLPEPVWIDDLAEGELPDTATLSPDGRYAVVAVVEPPRYRGVVVIRVDDRAVMRYIRFARAAAWSADGQRLVVGGEWGLLALDHHRPSDEAEESAPAA